MQLKYIAIVLALAAGVSALVLRGGKSAPDSYLGEVRNDASTVDRDSSSTPTAASTPKPSSSVNRGRPITNKPVASPENLREEDLLVNGSALNAGTVMNLARTEDGYNRLLGALAVESSVDAAEKTQKFQNLFLTSPMYLSGVIQVAELECGVKLCAAIVTSQDKGKISDFIASMSSAKEPPMYISMKVDSQSPNGVPSARWVFSNAPDVNSAGVTQ